MYLAERTGSVRGFNILKMMLKKLMRFVKTLVVTRFLRFSQNHMMFLTYLYDLTPPVESLLYSKIIENFQQQHTAIPFSTLFFPRPK